MGAISAKFSTPPSGETMDRTQKRFDLKWWHGPPLSPCKIWWKSRDARRRERMKCDVFHFFIFLFFFIFENNAPPPSTGLVRSWPTSRRHSVDICRPIYMMFPPFFAGEKRFPAHWTVLKIFDRGRYDFCPNGPKKIKKSEKMGANVRTTSTI